MGYACVNVGSSVRVVANPGCAVTHEQLYQLALHYSIYASILLLSSIIVWQCLVLFSCEVI